jgi:phosphoglycerate kinase
MQKLQEAQIHPRAKVFVRCDLDVPIENGKILERYRLDAALETLNYIKEKGALPIIAGHIGRPGGVYEEKLSTKNLFPYFNDKLGENNFELLENLRFDLGEEQNDETYAKEMAMRADIYVNECFSTSHRKHASFVLLPRLLPRFAGFRLQKEVETLGTLVRSAQKPFVGIVGGAKLEDKMPVINKLLTICDTLLLGGKVSSSWNDIIPRNLILPSDSVDEKDIGPQTIEKFISVISTAKTVLWAGPLGVYEEEKYINGTTKIASLISKLTKDRQLKSVIGGGDTITALERVGLLNSFSFVSTGGGAMLQFLAEGTLPGIEALN